MSFVVSFPYQTQKFSEEEIKDSSRDRHSQNVSLGGFEPATTVNSPQLRSEPTTAAAELTSNLCYLRRDR